VLVVLVQHQMSTEPMVLIQYFLALLQQVVVVEESEQ
tara:strand:+ start:7 stop:117 length:111 start_codon:yes stop_codon:yes gene_type:complete